MNGSRERLKPLSSYLLLTRCSFLCSTKITKQGRNKFTVTSLSSDLCLWNPVNRGTHYWGIQEQFRGNWKPAASVCSVRGEDKEGKVGMRRPCSFLFPPGVRTQVETWSSTSLEKVPPPTGLLPVLPSTDREEFPRRRSQLWSPRNKTQLGLCHKPHEDLSFDFPETTRETESISSSTDGSPAIHS